MKKIACVVFAAVLLIGCKQEKLDPVLAQQVAEDCLKSVEKGDYERVKTMLYSEELGKESLEDLTAKFKKLKEVTGPMTGIELKSTELSSEIGEVSSATLTYYVKHERVNTSEQFVIIEEGNHYRISVHLITNE